MPFVEGDLRRAGPFRLDGLEPGTYMLTGITKSAPALARAFAAITIELTDRNIDDMKIVMRQGVTLRAVVTMAEEKAVVPPGVSFTPASVILLTATRIRGEDYLLAEGLPPGEYQPILNTPPGYAVSDANYNGRSLLNATIDIEAQESIVNFTVTSRPARVTGIVRDANQNPLPDIEVILERSNKRVRTTSAVNGSFHVEDLAPGRYTVIQTGQKIDLDFGQSATLDIHIK